MQAFLASDVVYRGRVAPLIKEALDDDEIGGQQIAALAVPAGSSGSSPQTSPTRLGAAGRRRQRRHRRASPRPACTARASTRSRSATPALQPSPTPNRIPAAADLDLRRQLHQPGRERRARRPGRRDASTPEGGAGRSGSPTRSTPSRQGATAEATSRSGAAPAAGAAATSPSRSRPVPGEEKTDNNEAEYHVGFIARRRPAAASARSRPSAPRILCAVDDLTDPAGIVALAAGASPSSRCAGDRASPSACAACARPSGVVLGDGRRAGPRRPRRRAAAGVRARCTTASRRSRRTSTSAWRRPSSASTARSPTARSSATTPTASSRATSRRRSRCSTPTATASCSPRSRTATPRACTASRCIGGRGRARALARGDRGGPARARGRARLAHPRARRDARSATSGRRGTFSQEALLERPRARTAGSRSRCRPIHDAVLAVQRRDGRPRRSSRSRTRSRARSTPTLDALAVRDATTSAIVGEVVHPVRHCLSPASRSRSTRSRASSRTRRPRAQCARFLRARAAATPRSSPPPRPPRRCARSPRAGPAGGGPGRRSAPALAAELYGVRGAARRASRTWPATRPASCGSRRRGTGAGERRPVEDRARVLGRRRRLARLARALPVGVRVPRRQPHAHRVAAAQGRASADYMFFARPRGRARPTRPSPARSAACARRPRRSACSARTRAARLSARVPPGHARRAGAATPSRTACRRVASRCAATIGGLGSATLPPAMASAVPPGPLGSVPPSDHQRHGPSADGSGRGPVVACSCSTRRSSRSTSARSAARRCCCSRRRPRSSSTARSTCTGPPARCRGRS